jgi:AcrR family transcriptional regulator
MKRTKKEQLEFTAKELFWKYGFKKVTIDEICKKANVSRKTFYTFYENKSALVLYLLQQMTDEQLLAYNEIIESNHSFSEKMESLLKLKYESSNQFSMEFVADFFHPDSDDILAFYTKIVQESLALTNKFFREAQQNGEMNPDLDINFVMAIMQKMMEMCSTPEMMRMFPNTETMTRQISQFLIYGVMPVKSNHN